MLKLDMEGGRATGELGQLVCAVGLCQNLGALCAPLPPCAPGCAHSAVRTPPGARPPAAGTEQSARAAR